jgi:hypothetical protein
VQLVEEVDQLLPDRLEKQWDTPPVGDGDRLKRRILERLGNATERAPRLSAPEGSTRR